MEVWQIGRVGDNVEKGDKFLEETEIMAWSILDLLQEMMRERLKEHLHRMDEYKCDGKRPMGNHERIQFSLGIGCNLHLSALFASTRSFHQNQQ